MGLKIIKGTDVSLTLYIRDSDDQPFSLSGATEIIAQFAKTDDSALEKKLSLTQVVVASASLGKITVALSDVDTALLKLGDDQNFQVIVDVSTTRKIATFEKLLEVVDSQF